MGTLGVPEMIAIFVIALLLFGPKKLPELGRTLGKAITEFRRASNELKATFESHLSELDKENQSIKQSLSSYTSPDYSSSYSYDNEYHNYDSGYHQSSGSEETSASQSTTASATAPQDALASRDEHASVTPHVEGTVAHSTNLPAEERSSTAGETHPA
jgi:sec-independent protein translocase protein TatA